MAVLIKADGSQSQVSPKEQSFSLQELYDLLECELIDMLTLEDGRTMVIDDEGKFKEDAQVNKEASLLYCPNPEKFYSQRDWFEAKGAIVISGDDTGFKDHEVVGTVLICERYELD